MAGGVSQTLPNSATSNSRLVLLRCLSQKTQINLEHAARHVLEYTETTAERIVLDTTQCRVALTHVSYPALRKSVVYSISGQLDTVHYIDSSFHTESFVNVRYV